jgi:ribonuclease BN (tRNA processing enzyme)
VVRRAAAAHRLGIDGLDVKRLTRAFVTHLHSDHTVGYADLILTPWVLERAVPLQVYGPHGIREMTEQILAAYQEDIRERLEGLEPANDRGCRVEAYEIKPGLVYRDERVSVDAFPVEHGSWQALAFKVTTPGRTIVISGDTAPSATLLEQARGCDVLIHEVYSVAGLQTRPPDWQRYHASAHTSSHQVSEIASQIRPGLLILYHQLFWGVSEEALLKEVTSHYDGPVVSGRDLDVY